MHIPLFVAVAIGGTFDLVPQTPAPLSMNDAVASAMQRNPRSLAISREVSAARAALKGARALSNPQIAFAPALTNPGSDEELLVQQPLEINGSREARGAVANARLHRAEAQAGIERRDLVAQTKAAYVNLAQARERQTLAAEVLQNAEAFDQAARRQMELGSRAGVDQAHTSFEVARAKQQLRLAEAEQAAARAALNAAMGRDPADDIGELSPVTPPGSPLDRKALVEQALRSRGEISAAEAQAEEARAEASLVRAEGRPDLAPQLRAERVSGAVGVGVTFTIPLVDHGSRRGRTQQAEETARAQMDRAASARLQVRQEVEQALARVNAAHDVVETYRQGVLDRARQLVESSRVGFHAGATNILALLEAQRAYRTLHLQFIDAVADLARAHIELERVTGSAPVSAPGGAK